MSRAAPVVKKARSGWQSNRAQKTHKKNSERIVGQLPPIKKKLILNRGDIWLFQVGTKFSVEQGEKSWIFSLRYSAEGKFARLARLQGYTE